MYRADTFRSKRLHVSAKYIDNGFFILQMSGSRHKDLTGKRFGSVVVVKFLRGGKSSYWECLCDCGNTLEKRLDGLQIMQSDKCKCRTAIPRIGGKKVSSYRIWSSMKERCQNQNHKCYEDYGGRGINVCDRWMKFENFLADMGDKPEGLSLDRVDNNKGYSKENCRWTTMAVQGSNKRNNIMLTHNGVTKTMAEWCRNAKISRGGLQKRLDIGWPFEKAISTPVRVRKE
jgi:hypothetical protein